MTWLPVRDADPRLFGHYLRHYSSEKARGKDRLRRRWGKSARRVAGSGFHICLISICGRAAFVWRQQKYRKDGLRGVECSLFRNEGAGLSSALVIEAVALARQRWPWATLFSYCKPTLDRAGRLIRWGRCFAEAGWLAVPRVGDKFLWVLPA